MASHKPPFTSSTAHQKVKAAQALWNTRDPARVVQAYTVNSVWRNRSTFFVGHDAIQKFLTQKWAREVDYRLRKELFCFESAITNVGGDGNRDETAGESALVEGPESRGGKERVTGNKIAVEFWYEYRDAHDGLKWKRCHGIEHWTFDAEGKMEKRMMSGNDVDIIEGGEAAQGRWFPDGVDVDSIILPDLHT